MGGLLHFDKMFFCLALTSIFLPSRTLIFLVVVGLLSLAHYQLPLLPALVLLSHEHQHVPILSSSAPYLHTQSSTFSNFPPQSLPPPTFHPPSLLIKLAQSHFPIYSVFFLHIQYFFNQRSFQTLPHGPFCQSYFILLFFFFPYEKSNFFSLFLFSYLHTQSSFTTTFSNFLSQPILSTTFHHSSLFYHTSTVSFFFSFLPYEHSLLFCLSLS